MFASDLGFRPGFFPTTFLHDGIMFSLVSRQYDREGDCTGCIYRDVTGTRVTVWND